MHEQSGTNFERCDRYSRMSARTYSRVTNLLSRTRGKVLMGDTDGCNPDRNYIPPTVVVIPSSFPSSLSRSSSPSSCTLISCPWTDDPLMAYEVFGPVLLVVRAPSVQDALAHIQQQPKPLAMYLFTSSMKTARSVLDATQSGSAAVNLTVLQAVSPGAFVAGEGESGMGGVYGSTEGFKTFSHQRAVLICSPAMGALIETAMKTDKSEDEQHARPFASGGTAGHDDYAPATYARSNMLGGAHWLVMLRSMGVATTGSVARSLFETTAWITTIIIISLTIIILFIITSTNNERLTVAIHHRNHGHHHLLCRVNRSCTSAQSM